MPTVPSAQQIGQRVAPAAAPNVRFGANAPATAFAAPKGIDLSGVADTTLQLYREHQRIVEEERKKADATAVTTALAEHSHRKTRLLYDPKTGALNTQGENAFGMPEPTAKAYHDMTTEVRSTLTNDDQRLMYDRYAVNDWANTDESIQRHVAKQRELHSIQATGSALTNLRTEAVASYANPQHVEEIIATQGALVVERAQREGWSPEATQEEKANQASATYVGVINQMLAQRLDRSAKLYFDAHKKDIVGAALATITAKVETQSIEGEGARLGADIWKEYGPQDLNAPVKVETMQAELRKKTSDPDLLKVGDADIARRASAHNAEQAEVNYSNSSKVLGAYHNNVPYSVLISSPEFMALPGTEQNRLKDYFQTETHQRNEWAAGDEDRAAARKERERQREGAAQYWDISSNIPKLAAMTPDAIIQLEPTIGRTYVDALLKKRESLDNADNQRAATMDKDDFDKLAVQAGFAPKSKNKNKQTEMGELHVAVEGAIDAEQRRLHRALSREEKQKLMTDALDQKVMLDISGVGDPTKYESLLTPEQRATAYVPIKQIREREAKAGKGENFVAAAVKHIRDSGRVGPQVTDAVIEKQFARQIERAYVGYSRPGARRADKFDATMAEVAKILEGKQ